MLSGRLKPIPDVDRAFAREQRIPLSQGSQERTFLREVAGWDVRWQRLLFQVLLPIDLLVKHRIDPVALTDPQGHPVAFARPGGEQGSFRFELYHTGGASEPMAELELVDTQFNQIEVVWVGLQDPTGYRFDVDVLPGGGSSLRGTAGRNLVAETAAMLAGLAPGQVRRGIGGFGWLVDRIDTLMLCLNQRDYVARPLFYHMAILFERNGFSYVKGKALMEEVGRGFAPGGILRERLDGSTPFRLPEHADTIRGRSWAIHDGVLPQGWDEVHMIKRLGIKAGIDTAAGIPW